MNGFSQCIAIVILTEWWSYYHPFCFYDVFLSCHCPGDMSMRTPEVLTRPWANSVRSPASSSHTVVWGWRFTLVTAVKGLLHLVCSVASFKAYEYWVSLTGWFFLSLFKGGKSDLVALAVVIRPPEFGTVALLELGAIPRLLFSIAAWQDAWLVPLD